MDFYQSVFELIDMRSFSNLWFWIVLAVMWSSASHYVLGVPFDMVQRARRHGGDAMRDLEDMARVNVNRILYIANLSGLWLLGFGFFMLTSFVILGFGYRVEFAQAVFLLMFPMSLIGLLSVSTARLLQEETPEGEALCQRLTRHRLYTQIVGMISVLVTAMWGMYQNSTINVLGF